MGSIEALDPRFVDALRISVPQLSDVSEHRLASWIVARIDFITAGALGINGCVFANDSQDFGFKVKVSDQSKVMLAHGSVVVDPERIFFAFVSSKSFDLQGAFVELLAESPDELSKVEMFVRHPVTRKRRAFGWDGYSLLG